MVNIYTAVFMIRTGRITYPDANGESIRRGGGAVGWAINVSSSALIGGYSMQVRADLGCLDDIAEIRRYIDGTVP